MNNRAIPIKNVWVLFDWGDTLMRVYPEFCGPMCTWPHVAAFPEAEETLTRLRPRYHLGLATNAEDSNEEQIRAALRIVGLNQSIEQVFCTRRLNRRKPEREYFLAIAEALNISPEEIFMVGDSFQNDVLGAVNSGAHGIWLNTITNEDRVGPGYCTIHALREIIPVLSEWPVSTQQTNQNQI